MTKSDEFNSWPKEKQKEFTAGVRRLIQLQNLLQTDALSCVTEILLDYLPAYEKARDVNGDYNGWFYRFENAALSNLSDKEYFELMKKR